MRCVHSWCSATSGRQPCSPLGLPQPQSKDASAAGAGETDGVKYHVPGYTGFIPNSSEIAGRSYGKMTVRALNNPVEQLLVGDQIPPSPQATHEVQAVPTDTVVGLAEAAPRHVPGYTGFVPNTRERYAECGAALPRGSPAGSHGCGQLAGLGRRTAPRVPCRTSWIAKKGAALSTRRR